MKKQHLLAAASLALVTTGLGVGGAGLAAADPDRTASRSAERVYQPHPKTIVEVTGDAVGGFGIHRYDGSVERTPTRDAARAVCVALAEEVDRVVCRQEIRIWHRDLRDLMRSLNYTQSLRVG